MGVHITDTDTFALYDSVSGFAFGPTFDSADEAQSFLQMAEALALDDLRTFNNEALNDLYELWEAVNEAGHGTVNYDGVAAQLVDDNWISA